MSASTRLRLRVTPGASRTALDGRLADGRLKVRVAAPAEDGRANAAVISLLCDTLDLRPSAVRLVSGHGSRDKIVEIDAPIERLARLDRPSAKRGA